MNKKDAPSGEDSLRKTRSGKPLQQPVVIEQLPRKRQPEEELTPEVLKKEVVEEVKPIVIITPIIKGEPVTPA